MDKIKTLGALPPDPRELFEKSSTKTLECGICPRFCGSNFCGALGRYGLVSSVAVDPIEKKPLYCFCPGRPVLSIGGFGCNLRCPFCQNHRIAMSDVQGGRIYSPKQIAAMALEVPDNIGVAYTYNEPLINYPFLLDCARELRRVGLCNVLVTNGYINQEPLLALLPYIDAMNIDLKGFTEDFYAKLGGSLQPVLDTIRLSHAHCHIEVTTLVIPGENESHIEPISRFLAEISPSIPYHISRFFPRHLYTDKEATPPETIYRLCDLASQHLLNVFPGNL